jgi:hypothetical protein
MVDIMKNQQAFPRIRYRSDEHPIGQETGMSLRDYFAAKAMNGSISANAWHPDFILPANFNFDAGKRAADAVAVAAYKYADAMLKAREA